MASGNITLCFHALIKNCNNSKKRELCYSFFLCPSINKYKRKPCYSFFLYSMISHVNYVVTLLINCNVVASSIHCASFADVPLLFCHVHHLQGHTAQTPTEPLRGVVFGFSGVAAVLRSKNLWSTLPIQKSTKSHHGWYPHQCPLCVLGRFAVV